MNVQVHIFYSGIVQGVGFRYTTQRFATNLGLLGWVKNLSDGRVEMVVAGPKGQVEEFTKQLDTHFSGSIQNKEMVYQPVLEKFKNFAVV